MINVETLELEHYPTTALEVKKTSIKDLYYFPVYQLRIKGGNAYQSLDYTNPNLFLTKELCEKFYKEEVEPELINRYTNRYTGFALDITQPYEGIVEEVRVYFK